MLKKVPLGIAIGLVSHGVVGQEDKISAPQLEELLVHGHTVSVSASQVNLSDRLIVDSARALKSMPGANVNANGAVTGIAQYRGLFGDRVAVTIDGAEVLSGGPNAMDSPLSYVSPMITEYIGLDRGIASVSSAMESVGGHVKAKLARGEFGESDRFQLKGFLGTRYGTNGDTSNSALRFSATNDTHRLSLIAAVDRGDNLETPVGELFPSEMERDRIDVSYGFKADKSNLLAYYGVLDTQNAGTPALAMDIRSIETDLYGLKFDREFTDVLSLSASVNVSDVEHWMDNFSLRTAPMNGMMYRQNYATAEGTSYKLGGKYDFAFASLNFGVDGKTSEHDSTITNPNASMFEIVNFNNVERDVTGVYLEFGEKSEDINWEIGLRYNSVSTDADEVSVSGLMGMMGTNANLLAGAFNNHSTRERDFHDTDVVLKYGRLMSENTKFSLGLGSKTRAPSYQELYLWLPLQATGGLADGRNYVGNMFLESERSNELNLGFEWFGDHGRIAPQVFHKKINDYIQGTPVIDMTTNMVATMMSGAPALQFNNIDAEITGLDVAWNYIFSDSFFAEGVVSYINAESKDVDDNLYRQSPNNLRVAFHYQLTDWHFQIENHVYDKQDDVAEYNNELSSSGYGIVNAQVTWQPLDALSVDLRADNLGDKTYQDHLAGVNRVMMSDIAVGERIYGNERSFTLGVKYSF